MADTEQLTVPIVQKQIDTLKEHLYKLNDIRNSNIAAAASGAKGKRGGKLSNLTTEEHQIISRNEALRAEKLKLEKDVAGRDPPEVLDKKNTLREIDKTVEVLHKELERLRQSRDLKRDEAAVMQQRHSELQAIQASLIAEAGENRQQQRELQNKIKEAEKRLLASHAKFVKLSERSKHGVPAAEAKRLVEDVAAQDKQIEEMEEEVRRRRQAQQQLLMRNNKGAAATRTVSQKEKETAALQEQVNQLTEVLASRDGELKRSYDYAARKCRAGGIRATAVAPTTGGRHSSSTTSDPHD
jgi:hypothetical protein